MLVSLQCLQLPNFVPMIIAVNTRTFTENSAMLNFIEPCLQLIVAQHPEHSFIFIAEKPMLMQIGKPQNVQTVIIKQQAAIPLLWKIWHWYKLPFLLKKIKANVLINAAGDGAMRTKVPQCLIVNNLNFLLYPEWNIKKYKWYMQSNSGAFYQKATKIIAATPFLKKQLIAQYKVDESKIAVIYPGTNPLYQPITWDEKELIKEQFSNGKEYFLFYGEVNLSANIIMLLKAFSFFKKRQKSNMQLIIITKNADENHPVLASIATYKYRNEVILLRKLTAQNLHSITAAAYAFVSVGYYENDFSKLFNVLQCRVPVVTGNLEANIEMLAGAALYANPTNFEDIADKMMLLFKNEDKRLNCIENGEQIIKEYSWELSAHIFWKTILATIE